MAVEGVEIDGEGPDIRGDAGVACEGEDAGEVPSEGAERYVSIEDALCSVVACNRRSCQNGKVRRGREGAELVEKLGGERLHGCLGCDWIWPGINTKNDRRVSRGLSFVGCKYILYLRSQGLSQKRKYSPITVDHHVPPLVTHKYSGTISATYTHLWQFVS